MNIRGHHRGQGRAFQRGSVWWIAYSFRGKEKRESVAKHLRASGICRPATETDAERLLKLRLKQVGADSLGLKTFIPTQERIFVSSLLEALEADLRIRQARSLPSLQCHLKKVRSVLGDRRAVDVNAGMVGRYIEIRKSENAANATINRETGLLAQAFRLGVEH